MTKKRSTNALISDLKRKTRKKYSSEEKIQIIIEGIRGETTVAALCPIIPKLLQDNHRFYLKPPRQQVRLIERNQGCNAKWYSHIMSKPRV